MMYSHWEEFKGPWVWPHFTPKELACKGTGEYYHDPEFLDALERLRALAGKPIQINSGHRSPMHNARVGGAPFSQHKLIAADIVLKGHNPKHLFESAKAAGFLGIGLGGTFLHVDLRRPFRPGFPAKRLTIWYYSEQGKKTWKALLAS
jgi:zinc D-Ala-D-Ala carboxypeptidase